MTQVGVRLSLQGPQRPRRAGRPLSIRLLPFPAVRGTRLSLPMCKVGTHGEVGRHPFQRTGMWKPPPGAPHSPAVPRIWVPPGDKRLTCGCQIRREEMESSAALGRSHELGPRYGSEKPLFQG